jgi:hypothetical protein
VGLDRGARDGEAEARPLRLARRRGALEERGAHLARDRRRLVDDVDRDRLPGAAVERDRDAPPRGRALGEGVVAAPDALDELVARADVPGPAREGGEEVKLELRELDAASGVGDGAAVRVDGEETGARGERRGGRGAPAKDGADPGDERARGERLGDEVGGAGLAARLDELSALTTQARSTPGPRRST